MKYNELISISPGFKPSVNIKDDINNRVKIKSYIPTRDKIDIMIEISDSIVSEGNRVRHFTGAVGTGKSNLGLIIANYFKHDFQNNNDSPMINVMEKISNIDKSKYDKLIQNRNEVKGDFLIVTIEGYHNSINQALISGLDKALEDNSIAIMPITAYDAVCKLISEWQNNHPHIYNRLEVSLEKSKYENVKSFIDALATYSNNALEYFQSIYYSLTGIERFYSHHAQQASDVYNAVGCELLKNDYRGIVVLWDEFGSNLERLVSDIDGTEYLELQKFAENCNQLNKNYQIHLVLISHNNIGELASRSISLQKQLSDKSSNLAKFEGRFAKVKRFSYDAEEIYSLIINLIIKQDKFEDSIEPIIKSQINELLNTTFQKGIFFNLTPDNLHDLVKRAIPLHPFSLFALIKLCDKFAQNERSAFTFMCSYVNGTFLDFCNKEDITDGNKLNLLLPNQVLDYFYDDIKKGITTLVNNQYRDIFNSFERAINSNKTNTSMEANILKAVLLINLVGHYNFRSTAENIAYLLNVNSEKEKDLLQTTLDNLCTGQNKILSFSKIDFTYRFIMLKFDLEQYVKKRMIEFENNRKFDVISFLNSRKSYLGIPEYWESPEYRAKYKVARKLRITFINVDQLKNISGFINEIDKKYLDGIVLLVIPETSTDLEKASKYASSLSSCDQILVGIPTRTIKVYDYVKELSTIEVIDDVNELLEDNEKLIYEEEKEIYKEEIKELIMKEMEIFIDSKKIDEINWYHNNDIKKFDDLQEFICSIQENTFSTMPIVNHKSLLTDEGSDGQKPYRVTVVDKMFFSDAVVELNNEEQSPVKTIINTVLKECCILKNNSFTKPSEAEHRSAFIVWEEIENFFTNSSDYKNLSELFEKLKRPPYGLKSRLIPIFFASVMSMHINNLYIKTDNRAVTIIDGNLIENICDNPNEYSIRYSQLSEEDNLIIECLEKVFDHELATTPLRVKKSKERVGRLYRAISDWWVQLPQISRNYDGICKEALLFKFHIINNFERAPDKKDFLLKELKKIIPYNSDRDAIYQSLINIKDEFDNCLNRIKTQIYNSICNNLRELYVGGNSIDLPNEELLQEFYGTLNEYQKNIVLNGHENKVRSWLKNIANKINRKEAILDIAVKLVGIDIDGWSSKHLIEFNEQFRDAIKKILVTPEVNSVDRQIHNDISLSDIRLEIDGTTRIVKVSTKVDDFIIETKNLLDAMLDEVRLSKEQEISILLKLLEDRIKD